MAIELSSIPPEDREDFQRRLKTYGLDSSSVQDDLTVTPNAKVMLSYGPSTESARTPFVIQTSDLAEVKRMIGVDDRVFQAVSPRVALPKSITLGSRRLAGRTSRIRDSDEEMFEAGPGISGEGASGGTTVSDKLLAQLDTMDIDNVRLAARAFVRSNSKIVSSFSPLFPKVIGTITLPVWPLLSVTVTAGSTLEFGPGIHALVAYQVIVEQGGRIVSHGHLTVNCTRFRKPGRFRPIPAGDLTTTFRPIFS